MFLVPLFDTANYIPNAENWDYTVKNIHEMLLNSAVPLSLINDFIQTTIDNRSS